MTMITKGKRAWKRDRRWKWGFILDMVARENLVEKQAFEEKLERNKGANHMDSWVRKYEQICNK